MNSPDFLRLGTGHCLVYGSTMSGKTTMVKYLINNSIIKDIAKICIFTKVADWDSFTHPTIPIEKYDNLADNLKPVYEAASSALFIFDDINDELNKVDADVKILFTRGRHKKIMAMNLAHTINAVGPTSRNNSNYVFVASNFANNTVMVKEISDTFYGGKFGALLSRLKSMVRYEFLCIDIAESKTHTITPLLTVTTTQPVPPSMVSGDFSASNILHGGLLTQNKAAGRDFIDNSVTKVVTNLQKSEVIVAKETQHEVRVLGAELDADYAKRVKQLRIRDIALNGGRSRNEEAEMYTLLRSLTPIHFSMTSLYPVVRKFLTQVFSLPASITDHITPNASSELNKSTANTIEALSSAFLSTVTPSDKKIQASIATIERKIATENLSPLTLAFYNMELAVLRRNALD